MFFGTFQVPPPNICHNLSCCTQAALLRAALSNYVESNCSHELFIKNAAEKSAVVFVEVDSRLARPSRRRPERNHRTEKQGGNKKLS